MAAPVPPIAAFVAGAVNAPIAGGKVGAMNGPQSSTHALQGSARCWYLAIALGAFGAWQVFRGPLL
jgi:hypothetical protein